VREPRDRTGAGSAKRKPPWSVRGRGTPRRIRRAAC